MSNVIVPRLDSHLQSEHVDSKPPSLTTARLVELGEFQAKSTTGNELGSLHFVTHLDSIGSNGQSHEPAPAQNGRTRAGTYSRNGSSRENDSEPAKTGGSGDKNSEIPPPELFLSPSGYREFPTHLLPKTARKFIQAAAQSIGFHESYVALPVLIAAASAIGNARRIRIKSDWTEPSILWGVIIGESGTQKSPAINVAVERLNDLQIGFLKAHAEAIERYNSDVHEYETELKTRRRKGSAPLPPLTKPIEPHCRRTCVSDTTLEALTKAFKGSPRGLLLCRDELAGFFAGMDQYRQKQGADASAYLSMYNATLMQVDRKGAGLTFIPRPALSVLGGIQPEVFRRSLGREHFENGMAARFLAVMPPRKAKKWTDAEISPAIKQAYSTLIENLLSLEMGTDSNGEPVPIDIPLNEDARNKWIRFYNTHAEEHNLLSGDLAAVWSKLEGTAARLALVVHYMRRFGGDSFDTPALNEIDARDIEAGTSIANWFGDETIRIYRAFQGAADNTERDELVSLIESNGGRITPRELGRKCKKYSDSETAELALRGLSHSGYGRMVPTQPVGRGRPSLVFELFNSAHGDKNNSHAEDHAIVSLETSDFEGNGKP